MQKPIVVSPPRARRSAIMADDIAHQAGAVVVAVLSGALDLIAHAARSLWAVPWRWLLGELLGQLGQLAQLVRAVVAAPLRLVWLPLSYVARFLLVLFAPAIYLASYALAWANALVAFVVSLEFGAAAGIGIFAGIALAITSSLITSHLGMHDEEPQEQDYSLESIDKLKPRRRDVTPAVLDTDWYWTESSPSGRRRPSGLLSQTIHEEDDDSDL
ncbi:activator subunit [Purpureocillium lavendulum]|uniref:Activator subunit n=1 Tax=Purpureocillium lavendulum TaxID=1247861 RepID=A0AB34FGQ6_9HYPO|nr:activator subunit [Purpureocillium lavendulum]